MSVCDGVCSITLRIAAGLSGTILIGKAGQLTGVEIISPAHTVVNRAGVRPASHSLESSRIR